MSSDLKIVCRTTDRVKRDDVVRSLRAQVIPIDVRTEWAPGSAADGVASSPVFTISVGEADHASALAAIIRSVRDPPSA